MRFHFSILFLIAFSSFLLSTCADSRVAQDVEKLLETPLESDTRNEWITLVSLLNPANIADKIQEASFVSNLIGIPLTANSDNVRPEAQSAQPSPNSPDSGPELLQRSLKSLLSEETSKIIRSFETVVSSTVALGMTFQDVLESASSDRATSSSAPFTPLLKNIAKLVAIARDDSRARFPLPATAPGHAERVKRVSEALEHFQRLVIRLTRNHEIEQEMIERHLARVKPFLQDVGVLVGDVDELYPAAIEALVLNMSAVLFPEAMFLRSLVILYCFGPYVLGKDAISGWLLKHVSETLRV